MQNVDNSISSFDIISLSGEVHAMPEYQLALQLKGFSVSIFIFDQNYLELCAAINLLNRYPQRDPIFHLRNRTRLSRELHHIIRLLHNFVASAQSLIDHTRVFYRKHYGKTDKFPDYQEKVDKEFTHNPLAKFVKCLRQYAQHYRAPNIKMTFIFDRGDGMSKVKLSLLKEDLETFDGWTSGAKKYLTNIDEEIDILNLASEYRSKVNSFYRWFEWRLKDIHQAELRRFRTKERRLLLLQLQKNLDSLLGDNGQPTIKNGDDVFLSIFSADEFDILEELDTDHVGRAVEAIRLCEKNHFMLPNGLKSKIIETYSKLAR